MEAKPQRLVCSHLAVQSVQHQWHTHKVVWGVGSQVITERAQCAEHLTSTPGRQDRSNAKNKVTPDKTGRHVRRAALRCTVEHCLPAATSHQQVVRCECLMLQSAEIAHRMPHGQDSRTVCIGESRIKCVAYLQILLGMHKGQPPAVTTTDAALAVLPGAASNRKRVTRLSFSHTLRTCDNQLSNIPSC